MSKVSETKNETEIRELKEMVNRRFPSYFDLFEVPLNSTLNEKEQLGNINPFWLIAPPEARRSFYIVCHPYYHTSAKLIHALYARKFYQYIVLDSNHDPSIFENIDNDFEPQWTTKLLQKINEHYRNFELYMLK